jgi:hypothetical protein
MIVDAASGAFNINKGSKSYFANNWSRFKEKEMLTTFIYV